MHHDPYVSILAGAHEDRVNRAGAGRRIWEMDKL